LLETRVIPILLLKKQALVKTKRFRKFDYVGDPCNTIRIFNELEVDELFVLDIDATPSRCVPNFKILQEIAEECFMPLGYGGGVTSLEQAKKIFDIGFEKISLNSIVFKNPGLVTEISNHFGSQSLVISVDVKKSLLGEYFVYSHSGKVKNSFSPVDWAKQVETLGCGEILLTSIDREGSWSGFDLELVSQVANAVSVPVIAHGGAGNLDHMSEVVRLSKASAVALGSMVVYQKKDMGVLVNFPDKTELSVALKK
jgi:imidazole glycerol-phosphate synthase subunit HisF